MVAWLEIWDLPTDLAADSLRALRYRTLSLWHLAAIHSRIDVCEYIKSKGLLDMIDEAEVGCTPLHCSMGRDDETHPREETARWMMNNGANINAITNNGTTVFNLACRFMSFASI